VSARATFWAWEVDIPSSEKLVLLCLSDCHNADTGQCNPSVSYISKKTSLDRKTVLKSLRSLSDLEILSRAKVKGASNQYFLVIGGSPILGHGQSHISPEPVPSLGHKPINKPKKNLRWEKGDMETVDSIFNLLLALNPKHRKPSMDTLANEGRLMRENDGPSPSEIMDLFSFANSDNFWKSNILSPKKLREKWDVLTIKKGDTKQAPTEVWI